MTTRGLIICGSPRRGSEGLLRAGSRQPRIFSAAFWNLGVKICPAGLKSSPRNRNAAEKTAEHDGKWHENGEGSTPPGHPYWTTETLIGIQQRHPDLDLTPWA
jgi:hypothetical protein